MDNNRPSVSIVIPCRNEEKFIGKCLDSIIVNDYPKDKLEVLVVDGMSQDSTRRILEDYSQKFPFIRYLDNGKKITPVSMNIGIKYSKNEIIMIMGAHNTLEKDYISKCLQYLNEYKADNVGGILKTVPANGSSVARTIALSISHPFAVGNSYFRIGSKEFRWVDTVFGGCYRKEVFDKIGLFNEGLARGQDMEFNLRLKIAGGKILLVPEIVSYYYARSDLKSFGKHNFLNGVWVIYSMKFVQHFPVSLRHLVPLVFVSSLITSAVLSLFFPIFFWLFLLIAGSYFLSNLYFSSQVAIRQKNLLYFFIMPLIFATLHISYGLGSVVGLLRVLISKQFWRNQFKVGIYEPKRGRLKRLFDIIFSFIGLLILLPFLLLIALLIKLGSKGPVFYRGVRVGLFGKLFRIYKFRTMVVNAEKLGGPSTANDDPRLTGTGKFLRKYKLDELPQLINVLKGNMSFVGPRPEVQQYVDMYTEEEKAILNMRPGITDWASIWNSDEGAILAGSPDPEKTYLEKIRPEKVRLQLEYVKKHSLRVDFQILAKTFIALVGTRLKNKIVSTDAKQ